MTAKELARIKKLLTGAEGKRLDQLNAAQWGPPQRFDNAASRRAVAKLFLSTLRGADRSGLDYRGFQKQFADLVAAGQASLLATAAKSKAAAVKNSGAIQKVLSAEAAARVKALEGLVAIEPTVGAPQYELLNTPFLIWPTNSVDLEASEILPANSFAKFRVATEESFLGDVKFYYLWQNPNDKFAVINVSGYLIFHGHAFAGVGGGVCPADRRARISIDGRLTLLEWWNQPPTQPMQQPDQSVNALTLSLSASGFSEVGALEARDLFRGYDLRHTQMVVPPLSVVVITVSAAVDCSTGDDDGRTEVDFASGEFRVSSPAVLVTILT